MTELVIDTTELRRAGDALRTVAAEFSGANSRSDDVADAVGHPGLAERVREFAHNWDDRRAEMLQQIEALAAAAAGIADSFEGLEAEFVAALRSGD